MSDDARQRWTWSEGGEEVCDVPAASFTVLSSPWGAVRLAAGPRDILPGTILHIDEGKPYRVVAVLVDKAGCEGCLVLLDRKVPTPIPKGGRVYRPSQSRHLPHLAIIETVDRDNGPDLTYIYPPFR